ncbi:MAG: N-acetyltransferase [Gemmatimonadota bacterium]
MSLEIISAESKRDINRFVDLPWQIYTKKDHAQWIPPLRLTVLDALDRKKPFYRDAERALFIAVRDGKDVGRIAAIENRTHNRVHGDKVGFWGFFESVDDQEVVNALFDAAARWLAGRGLDTMRGPVMPSTNYDCGLLVDGFEHEPTFMTPWNPRSYPAMIERAGQAKVKDLVAYVIPMADGFELPPTFKALAERAQSKAEITFRDLDLSNWGEELERCWDVYNSAWEENWGFVPMTKDEFVVMAKDLKPLMITQFVFMAEVKGVPVGFMFIVPDFNKILKNIPNGKLFPTGAFKLLLGKSKLRDGRIMAFGIKKEFRSRSIFPVFAYEAFRRGRAYGATSAEASWILEDNELLLAPLRGIGLKEHRRWRLYDGTTSRSG